MSNVTINVEFLAGITIDEAVKEAKEQAVSWGVCYVTFDFNGVRMSIGQLANTERAISSYKDRVGAKSQIDKYVCEA